MALYVPLSRLLSLLILLCLVINWTLILFDGSFGMVLYASCTSNSSALLM